MVSLGQLLQMFVGKNVRVSHPTVPTATSVGVCRDVLEIDVNYFIICLMNGRRFSIMTETVDEISVEGRINSAVRSCQKIEIIY